MARLKPLNDVVFKKLFGEKNDKVYLISFLSAILSKNVEDLEIQNERTEQAKLDDKMGIMDIKAILSTGEKVNIEVQLINPYNMKKRTLFYWSKLYLENFKSGNGYDVLFKTITINILGYKEFDTPSYVSTFHLYEDTTRLKMNDEMEIHFIEIPKFKGVHFDKENSLHRWLWFLQEDIDSNVLEEIINMDEVIRKAEEKLEALSSDPQTIIDYELREKFLSDQASRIQGAKEEGLEKGIEQGIEEGEVRKAKEIAKKMIAKGSSNEIIEELTSLSIDTIERLRKE